MNHMTQSRRVISEMERYGGDVLHSGIMQEAFEQTHHRHSTVGIHTLRVTRASIRIGHVLEKLHIPVDIPAVITGSLCHDLGIIGRNGKYASNRECFRKHASDSVTVAKELLDDLSEKTEAIIERHMWPMNRSEAPNYIEGFIVSTADKYGSVVDFFKGVRGGGRNRA